MKRLILAAALCAIGVPALAQNGITIYGVFDVGVQYMTNADAAGHSQTSVASGSYQPSRFGFKGQEDLGGGYKALFVLENGFNADTGAQSSASTLWNRFAFVGLQTPLGIFTLGRQGSLQFDKTVFYEPLYYSTYSMLSLNGAPIQTFKINNSVKFQSAAWHGWNVAAVYSAGQELAGNSHAGRHIGGSLEYVDGPLSARVLQETTWGNAGAGVPDLSQQYDRRTSAAAVYKRGRWTWFGDWIHIAGKLQISPRGDLALGAAAYDIDAWRFVLEAGRYRFSDNSGRPQLVTGLVQYAFSRRTSLYAAYGDLINSGGSNFGIVYPSTTARPGQSQGALTLGIDHRF
jgi:predicted porin